jgi:uncharacterized repeat protein (TIGR01451 family)
MLTLGFIAAATTSAAGPDKLKRLMTIGPTVNAVSYSTISSAGPLTDIFLGEELSAQIYHQLDGTTGEVYPPATIPADYGTFVVVNDVLYAPDFNDHGGSATGSIGTYTALTPVSQSGVTGSGTAADPYTVTTVADVGATGLRLSQVDSYVVGQETYATQIVISNTGGSAVSGLLYRALDCYLGGSDSGYGLQLGTSIGCSEYPNNNPVGRVEQLVPLTSGSSFYEAGYSEVWSAIGTHQPFNNTCRCNEMIDNGVGISWGFSVPGGGQATFSHLTVFSPEGTLPVTMTKTADSSTSIPGAQNGYTITVDNPNAESVVLSSLTDLLPTGFSYVVGSTTGATTADPTIAAQQLTWTGPFPIAANASISIHFSVIVANAAGQYWNEASGEAGDFTVAGTGRTAAITVTGDLSPAAIPTLNTSGMLLFAAMMAFVGVAVLLWRRIG